MKKWIVVLAVFAAAYFLFFRSSGVQDALAKRGAESDGGIDVIKHAGGSDFDVRSLPEAGHITVVEFYTDACPGCQRLRSQLNRFLPLRPDIVIKMVRMPNDWNVPWAKRQFHLNIGFTPFIQIYDGTGKLVVADEGEDDAANDALYDLMNAELRKDWEKKHQSS